MSSPQNSREAKIECSQSRLPPAAPGAAEFCREGPMATGHCLDLAMALDCRRPSEGMKDIPSFSPSVLSTDRLGEEEVVWEAEWSSRPEEGGVEALRKSERGLDFRTG